MRVGPYVAFLRAVLRSNLSLQPPLYKLTFAVSYRCNLACQRCQIWKKPVREEMTVEEIDRVFASAPHFLWISLTGGETYLRDDILEIARSAMRRNPKLLALSMNTNGALTDKICAVMSELVKDPHRPPQIVVTVSVDGPQDLHDAMRGKEGSWDKAMETFRRLREIPGMDVIFGTTISEHNVGRVAEMFEAVQSVCPGVDKRHFHFNLFHRSEHYYGNCEMPMDRSAWRVEDLSKFGTRPFPLWNANEALGRAFLVLARRYVRTGRSPIPCEALRSSCFLDPTGDAYPCITYTARLGSVREAGYDLIRVLSDARAEAIRAVIRRLDCPNCWTPCEAYQSILGHLFSVARVMASEGIKGRCEREKGR